MVEVTYREDTFYVDGISGDPIAERLKHSIELYPTVVRQFKEKGITVTAKELLAAFVSANSLDSPAFQNPFDKVIDTFATVIKEDRDLATDIYLAGMSAYGSEPTNLEIKAPTSEGKTYAAINVLQHFPKGDVLFVGKLTPSHFAYQHGTLIDQNGEPLRERYEQLEDDLEKLKDKDKNRTQQADRTQLRKAETQLANLRAQERTLIILQGKIIVFLEPPDPETWVMLKPILSHDVWEYEYRTVVKSRSGRNIARIIILRGWPATIICTAKDSANPNKHQEGLWKEIESRVLTASPKMNRTKYRAAIKHTATTQGLPDPVVRSRIKSEDHERVRIFIQTVRDHWQLANIDSTKPPGNRVWNPYCNSIGEYFPAEQGRNMRDASRFMSIMNCSAFSLPFHRPRLVLRDQESVIVTREDFNRGAKLFFSGEVAQTVFTGIPAQIIEFFEKVVVPLCNSEIGREQGFKHLIQRTTVAAMREKYREVKGRSVSADTIRLTFLDTLKAHGYVDYEVNQDDKRKYDWFVIGGNSENSRNSTKLTESANLTLETLQAFDKEFQSITESDPQYVSPTGQQLTLEQLLRDYLIPISVIESSTELGVPSGSGTELTDSANIGQYRNLPWDESEIDLPQVTKHLKEVLPKLQYKTTDDVIEYCKGVYGPDIGERLSSHFKPRLLPNPQGFLELT